MYSSSRTTDEIYSFQDLTRQLQQTKKKLEMYENKEAGKETTSMGSRNSSTTSLETMNNQHGGVIKTPTEPTAPVSNNVSKQECIPVGCVPPAAVKVSGGGVSA